MSNPITDLKHELLAAAERQHRQDAVPAERSPLRTRVPRPRLLVTSAALAIAAGVALFVTAPGGLPQTPSPRRRQRSRRPRARSCTRSGR
jgi:hypothetical protein